MVILEISSLGAQYSILRNHAVAENEPSPQSLTREIKGSGGIKGADVQIFSLDSGRKGRISTTSFRILPADKERTKIADMIDQIQAFRYSGYSAQPVPEGGLLRRAGGLLSVHKSEHTGSNGIWLSELAVFLPEEHFDLLFNAIVSAPTKPKSMRLVARINLFETEIDAALNEQDRTFGLRLESGDADHGHTAALLDDIQLTFSPSPV
jgi:hypothetical protein